MIGYKDESYKNSRSKRWSEAVRKVRSSGMIFFMREKLYFKELIPFIGEKVFINDFGDFKLWIYTVEYHLYSTIRKKSLFHERENL